MTDIHPLAYVDPSSEVGEGTKIGAFAYVGPGVVIGSDNEVRAHAVIEGPGTTIGDGNVFFAGSVVGGEPQDKKYAGEPTRVVIGNANHFREHVTVNRGTGQGGGVTTIGDDNLLLAACHVAHDCEVGSHVVLSNNVLLAGHVVVEDYAIMNGACAIHHFGSVGTLAYIGGLSRLVRDAPPYMVTEGNPARTAKVNAVGLRRGGVPQERIEMLQLAFRHLFRRKHPTLWDAFDAIDGLEISSPEVTHLREFLEAMSRGKNGRAREALR